MLYFSFDIFKVSFAGARPGRGLRADLQGQLTAEVTAEFARANLSAGGFAGGVRTTEAKCPFATARAPPAASSSKEALPQ